MNPETPNAVGILRRAKQRIEDPNHWTQGRAAVDRHGCPVMAQTAAAARFCALGAVWHEFPNGDHDNSISFLDAASLELYGVNDVSEVNDLHTHADVMKVYDRAIELAERKEPRTP